MGKAKSDQKRDFSKIQSENGAVKTHFTTYFPLKTIWLNETRLF